jgi:hypothetical protein
MKNHQTIQALALVLTGVGALFGCEQPELWAVPNLQRVAVDGDVPGSRDAAVEPDLAPPEPVEARYTLKFHEKNLPLELNMERDEVRALLGAISDDVVLLQLDPVDLLRNVLTAVKTACGTDWRNDVRNPVYDCDLTPLGRTFSRPGQPWQQSPEFAMVRLLTMTPANVIVGGSSLALMQALAEIGRIEGGFSQILADSLGIARTAEIVPDDVAVYSLKANLLGSHPNTTPDGRLEITLGDVLDDLRPLAQKLGPYAAGPGEDTGSHPGVLDPDAMPVGRLLGPEFRMHIVAESNLRVLDGIKAGLSAEGRGQENLVLLYDDDREPATTPLRFNFADPSTFEITGLFDEPTVDLDFRILEHDKYVNSCLGEESGCQRNLPGRPASPDSVWAVAPWTLEYIVADAARVRYAERRVRLCYINCLAEVEIGQGEAPAGWAHFGLPFDLGPADQYIWELLSEVVQVNLHRADLAGEVGEGQPDTRPEGAANVAFAVRDVPVGLTGEDCAERVRPMLVRQAGAVSDFLFGDYRARSGDVDFAFRREADGRFVLQFLAAEDLPPGTEYRHRNPGFFADAALSTKVSRTEAPGFADTTHEKLVVVPREQTVFIEDADGRRFRVRVFGSFAGDPQVDVALLEVQP